MNTVNTVKRVLVVAVCLSSLFLAAAPAREADPEAVGTTGKNARRQREYRGVFPVRTIAVITPASYPGSRANRMGVELLKKASYNVKVLPHAFEKPSPEKMAASKNYASLPVELRLEDFYKAWNDPEVEMILCSRGGTGCQELMSKIDWSILKKRPDLIFMGFSDVTLVHCRLLQKGYGRPVAGPTAGSLPGLDPKVIPGMKKMLSGEEVGPIRVTPLVKGECSGKPLAGLLSRFVRAKNADFLPETRGRVIFIEGVKCTAEAVKRDLEELKAKKFFDGVAGVVFCQFTGTNEKAAIRGVIREFAPKLGGIPVCEGFPFGHAAGNHAVDLTRTAVIRDDAVCFPAVKKK